MTTKKQRTLTFITAVAAVTALSLAGTFCVFNPWTRQIFTDASLRTDLITAVAS